MDTHTPYSTEPTPYSSDPTPIHTNFDEDPAFMLPNRVIAVLCAKEDRHRMGEGTIMTWFEDSLVDMILRLGSESRPLVLLHIKMLPDEELETANLIRDLPSQPTVAIVSDPENMSRAIQIASDWGQGWVFPDECLRFPRQAHQWAQWIDQGGPRPGLSQYLNGADNVETRSIDKLADKDAVIEEITAYIDQFRPEDDFQFDLRLILEELINNGIAHAFCTPLGTEKYTVRGFKKLERGEELEVAFGMDQRTFGLTVTDNQGRLTREKVIEKIQRHVTAEGVMDQSGRGLYLVHSLAGRAIYNLRAGELTELVALFPLTATSWLENPPMHPMLIFSGR